MPDVSGVCRAVRLIVFPRIPAMDRCLKAWGAVYRESRNNSSAYQWIACTNSESSAAAYFSTLRSFSPSLTTNVSMSNAFATAVGGTPTVSRRSMMSVNSSSVTYWSGRPVLGECARYLMHDGSQPDRIPPPVVNLRRRPTTEIHHGDVEHPFGSGQLGFGELHPSPSVRAARAMAAQSVPLDVDIAMSVSAPL